MRVFSKNKIMDFAVIGYQFPDHIVSGESYDHDANWLICEIKYAEDDCNHVYTDACLLTYELQELTKAMQKILNKEEDAYISEFLEPNLQIAIARVEEKVVFTIRYVYDITDKRWNKRIVSSVMDAEMAQQAFHELTKFQKAYPER